MLFVVFVSIRPLTVFAEPVDFQRDVWPILASRCIQCHGPAKQKSSLRVDSLAAILKGGDNGAAIVAGDPANSYLLELVSGTEGDLRMPPEGERLSSAQINTLRRWITEGAKWPADFVPVPAEAEVEGHRVDELLTELVRSVEVPRL